MSDRVKLSIIRTFSELEDLRVSDNRKRHELVDIVVISILAVISGCEDWVSISEFGRSKEKWLGEFLKLDNGIPSHDTFRRVFSLLDPKCFSTQFAKWAKTIGDAVSGGDVIAIDGKTLRRSFDKASGLSGLHLVNAWSCKNRVVLGQLAVDKKSNEITAIPKLIEQLDLAEAVVTIDAMGCQKDIAAAIANKSGGYTLQLKANHKLLYQEAIKYFKTTENTAIKDLECLYHKTVDGDHGRIETREYYLSNNLNWCTQKDDWQGLTAIGMVVSHREIGGQTTTEKRYFLTSIDDSAKEFARTVRDHWKVENSLHWSLDVTFREDDCRIRERNAAQNFSLLRKIALSLIKNYASGKDSIKTKRLKAAWDNSFLVKIISQ